MVFAYIKSNEQLNSLKIPGEPVLAHYRKNKLYYPARIDEYKEEVINLFNVFFFSLFEEAYMKSLSRINIE